MSFLPLLPSVHQKPSVPKILFFCKFVIFIVLVLFYSSSKVKVSFSISVGIPVDNIILITQLIKKQGLSQVHSLFYFCTSLSINFNNIWLLHLINVKTDRKFTF